LEERGRHNARMKPSSADKHPSSTLAKPPWLRVRLAHGEACERVRQTVRRHGLETVCEQALCPNQGECWGRGTATVLILGGVCTRDCGFCAVRTGIPQPPDPGEPDRVAEAAAALQWKHLVITSVTRDDLPDGGASQFAACVAAIRERAPTCTVELLIPDFQGDAQALAVVMHSRPDILGHNLETVPQLYPQVRHQADFERSLELLRRAKALQPHGLTKSGIMVGLGETWEELLQTMERLRQVGCDILTLGQYLSPTRQQLPVVRYYSPEDFQSLREAARELGFRWVEAGPLVRSSYHADDQVQLVHQSSRD
jgi:lipoic acid synthetase